MGDVYTEMYWSLSSGDKQTEFQTQMQNMHNSEIIIIRSGCSRVPHMPGLYALMQTNAC